MCGVVRLLERRARVQGPGLRLPLGGLWAEEDEAVSWTTGRTGPGRGSHGRGRRQERGHLAQPGEAGSGSKQAGQEEVGGGGLRITVKGTPEPSNRGGWAVEGSGASEPLGAGLPVPPSPPASQSPARLRVDEAAHGPGALLSEGSDTVLRVTTPESPLTGTWGKSPSPRPSSK